MDERDISALAEKHIAASLLRDDGTGRLRLDNEAIAQLRRETMMRSMKENFPQEMAAKSAAEAWQAEVEKARERAMADLKADHERRMKGTRVKIEIELSEETRRLLDALRRR